MSPLYASSRRAPYPFDVLVNGVGMMLVATGGSEITDRKSKPIEIGPTSTEYSSVSPFQETAFAMERLVDGFGQRIQPDGDPQRYYYALDGDGSINGWRMKGPYVRSETVNSGHAIVQFVLALHGGTETLFALTDNSVHRRVSDGSWSSSLTPGSAPRQAVRFKGAGGSPVDGLYLATQSSNLYQYDGAAWSLAAAGAGPPANLAQNLTVIRDELWVGYTNFVVKVEQNPLLRADYAAPIRMGDASTSVNWLATNKDQLYVFKADGIFILTPNAVDRNLYPGLGLLRSTANGVNARVWLDSLWVPWSDSFYQILADGSLSPEGTEKLLENDSPVRGRFVDSAGHNTWFNYCLLYDSISNATYLGKYGTWVEEEDNPGGHFIPAYHFALKAWANKRGTCLAIVPASVTGDTNDRLYVGFADGTVSYLKLPRGGPNPLNDPVCEYTDSDAYFYWPDHHGHYKADNKIYRGWSVFGPHLDADNYVQIQYRLDPAGDWQTLQRDDESSGSIVDVSFIASGQRSNVREGLDLVSRSIQVREVLKHSAAVVPPSHETPVLESVALHEQVRPHVALDWEFTVDASDYLPKRNGAVDRRRAVQIRDQIRDAVTSPGPVAVTLPDGTTEEMSWIDYAAAQIPKTDRHGLAWAVPVRCVQLKTLTEGLVVTGLTYGTLEGYSYGELEQLL